MHSNHPWHTADSIGTINRPATVQGYCLVLSPVLPHWPLQSSCSERYLRTAHMAPLKDSMGTSEEAVFCCHSASCAGQGEAGQTEQQTDEHNMQQ